MRKKLSSSYVLLIILLISPPFEAAQCDSSEREYSCDCIFESSNRTVFDVENKYNATDDFIPAIRFLHYCQGKFHCRPNFVPSQSLETINTDNYILCFSDDSCLSNGGFEVASLRGFSDACVKNSCMFLKDLVEFNITNAVLEVGAYMCIRVGPNGLKAPYCLKPACKSFVAIEKLCVCDYEDRNCKCSSYCQNLYTSPSYKTYGLFLSFGDIYTTKGNKVSFLHWIILVILCIGLTILLIIFCKLCKAAVEPSCGNEMHNPEILRHILTTNIDSGLSTASVTMKNNFSGVDRSSPPPSYEQVLKDKCIEFKKSIA